MIRVPPPTGKNILAVRTRAGMSQTDAANLVYLGSGSRWSEYERGARQMDRARWELFLLKVHQHPLAQLSLRQSP